MAHAYYLLIEYARSYRAVAKEKVDILRKCPDSSTMSERGGGKHADTLLQGIAIYRLRQPNTVAT